MDPDTRPESDPEESETFSDFGDHSSIDDDYFEYQQDRCNTRLSEILETFMNLGSLADTIVAGDGLVCVFFLTRDKETAKDISAQTLLHINVTNSIKENDLFAAVIFEKDIKDGYDFITVRGATFDISILKKVFLELMDTENTLLVIDLRNGCGRVLDKVPLKNVDDVLKVFTSMPYSAEKQDYILEPVINLKNYTPKYLVDIFIAMVTTGIETLRSVVYCGAPTIELLGYDKSKDIWKNKSVPRIKKLEISRGFGNSDPSDEFEWPSVSSCDRPISPEMIAILSTGSIKAENIALNDCMLDDKQIATMRKFFSVAKKISFACNEGVVNPDIHMITSPEIRVIDLNCTGINKEFLKWFKVRIPPSLSILCIAARNLRAVDVTEFMDRFAVTSNIIKIEVDRLTHHGTDIKGERPFDVIRLLI